MSSANSIRAGAAFIEVGLRDKVAKGLRRIQARLNAFAAGVSTLGASMMGTAGLVLGPLAGAVKVFTGLGDSVGKMAKRTGLSSEAVSTLSVAANRSGASVQSLEAGVRGMNRMMLDAARGTKASVDTLDDLGLSLGELQGLNPEQRFKVFADALSRIPDPGRRAALAMKVFGRSGTELLPMLAGGAEGIEALQQHARELGLELSSAETGAAEALTDKLSDLWDVLKVGTFKIGAAVSGPLTQLIDWFLRASKGVMDWIADNQELIGTIAKVAAMVFAAGGALLAIGGVISAVAAGFGVLSTVAGGAATAVTAIGGVIAFLVSPVGLAIAGLAALVTWFATSTEAGQKMVSWIMARFRDLAAFVGKVFGGIRDALMAGDFKLAGQVLWAGLKVAWQTGVRQLMKIWLDFKTWFMRIFDELAVVAMEKMGRVLKDVASRIKGFSFFRDSAKTLDIAGNLLIGGAKGAKAFDAVNARDRARRAEADAALAEADAALKKAEDELSAATATAKRKRDELPAAPAMGGGEPEPVDFGHVPEAADKVASFGTFSATAAARFGREFPALDEIAKAAKASLEVERAMLAELRDFSAVT